MNIDLYITYCARELGALSARTFNIEKLLFFTHYCFTTPERDPIYLTQRLHMATDGKYLTPCLGLSFKAPLPGLRIDHACSNLLNCGIHPLHSRDYYLSYTDALMSELPFSACRLPPSETSHMGTGRG